LQAIRQEEEETIRMAEAARRAAEAKDLEKQKRRDAFAEEPAAGKETTTIKIVTPSKTYQRRFHITESLQVLFDYISATHSEDIDGFQVVTVRPRKVLTNVTETLKDANLVPNAIVYLEPLE